MLAGYTLGEATVATRLTVFELTGAAQPTQRQLTGFINGLMNNVSDLPVHRALNTALLLQTLDDDGDPANGINITDADALTATTYTLDLTENSATFSKNLRKVLKQAALERNPQSPIKTIRHLVQAGVVTTPLYRVTREEVYNLGDDIADERYTYIWDDDGDAVFIEKDFDGDDTIDVTVSNSYDAAHNLILKETDAPPGGPLEYVLGLAYDADGNITQEEIDSNGDGAVDLVYTYAYDTYGNQLVHEKYLDAEVTPYEICTNSYNIYGDLVLYEKDTDADGNPDSIETYTYDGEGNQIGYERDDDPVGGDAEFIITLIYTHDPGGSETRREIDSDADGTADTIEIYTYDAHGNWTGFELDTDAGGSAQSTTITYVYNSRGNRVEEYHTAADGSRSWTRASSYDGNDNRVYREFDTDADGYFDDADITWVYDADGNEIRREDDQTGDDEIDVLTTHTYEAATLFPDTPAL